MDKFLYIIEQLQEQACLATPVIPICDERMQQLIETMSGATVGTLPLNTANDTLQVMGRFAFSPGDIPEQTRISALSCLEKMTKFSPEIRVALVDQGHVQRLVDLLANADVRTEEPLILAVVEILAYLLTDYLVDLRAAFCNDEMAEIVENILYQCMLEPRLLGTDGPAVGEAALRLLLAIIDRFSAEIARYKESFYAVFVLFLKKRGGRSGLKGARGLLVQCMLQWLLHTFHYTECTIDIWPLVDLEGLFTSLKMVLSPHASQLTQRTYLVPLIEVCGLLARQGPPSLKSQLREMLLGDDGDDSSDVQGAAGAESVPQALLRLSRSPSAELSRPLRDLYAFLN